MVNIHLLVLSQFHIKFRQYWSLNKKINKHNCLTAMCRITEKIVPDKVNVNGFNIFMFSLELGFELALKLIALKLMGS